MKDDQFYKARLTKPVLDTCTGLQSKSAYFLTCQKQDHDLEVMKSQVSMTSLESEREMNALLRNENKQLSQAVDSLKQQIGSLQSLVTNTQKTFLSLETGYACEMIDNMQLYSAFEIKRALQPLLEGVDDVNK